MGALKKGGWAGILLQTMTNSLFCIISLTSPLTLLLVLLKIFLHIDGIPLMVKLYSFFLILQKHKAFLT